MLSAEADPFLPSSLVNLHKVSSPRFLKEIDKIPVFFPASSGQKKERPSVSLLDKVLDKPIKHYTSEQLCRIRASMQPCVLNVMVPFLYRAQARVPPQPTEPDSVDVKKSLKRLRATLNKVSIQNVGKLSLTLCEETKDPAQLERLILLIFDRVASQSALAELYSLLVKAIQENLEAKLIGSSNHMQDLLEEIAEKSLIEAAKEPSTLIGNAKFVTQLFICELLSPSYMILVYDALLMEARLSEENLEAFCHLFMLTYLPLSEAHPKETNDTIKYLIKLRHDPRVSKRLQYMIQEVIESTQPLLIPISAGAVEAQPVRTASKTGKSDDIVCNDRARKIKFMDEQPFEDQKPGTDQASQQLPILKARISPEVKVKSP